MSSAFNYVTAEKATLYRPVMRAFANAKAHFVVHLRPEDVLNRLDFDNVLTLEDISTHWNNSSRGETSWPSPIPAESQAWKISTVLAISTSYPGKDC